MISDRYSTGSFATCLLWLAWPTGIASEQPRPHLLRSAAGAGFSEQRLLSTAWKAADCCRPPGRQQHARIVSSAKLDAQRTGYGSVNCGWTRLAISQGRFREASALAALHGRSSLHKRDSLINTASHLRCKFLKTLCPKRAGRTLRGGGNIGGVTAR